MGGGSKGHACASVGHTSSSVSLFKTRVKLHSINSTQTGRNHQLGLSAIPRVLLRLIRGVGIYRPNMQSWRASPHMHTRGGIFCFCLVRTLRFYSSTKSPMCLLTETGTHLMLQLLTDSFQLLIRHVKGLGHMGLSQLRWSIFYFKPLGYLFVLFHLLWLQPP